MVQNALQDTTNLLIAYLSVQQLQHMIADSIRAQYGGSPQSYLFYAKPYSRWIDELRMPLGYQPPQFHQRTVGLPELANTKQRKDKPVVDYIEWRNIVLNCKECISEASSIDIRVHGMHWGLLYSIKSNMPHSFEELSTRAHDVELKIARHGSHFPKKKELKKDVKKEGKSGKSKETMAITTSPVQISVKKQNPKPKTEYKATTSQPKKNWKQTLKELEEKDYPFSNSKVPDILDRLLKQKLIELPTKSLEEARRVNDPKYCSYDRIVNHPLEKCFILKDLILQMINEKKIILDVNENVVTAPIPITMRDSIPSSNKASIPGPKRSSIPGPAKALILSPRRSSLPGLVDAPHTSPDKALVPIPEDEEGWILVKRNGWCKLQRPPPPIGRKEKRIWFHAEKEMKCKKEESIKVIPTEEKVIESSSQKPVTLSKYFPDGFLPEKHVALVYTTTTHDNSKPNVEKEKQVEKSFKSRTTSCMATISFTNDDLIRLHKTPLYVSGYIRDHKISRMLVDNGSAENIMPIITMKKIGITMDKLSKSEINSYSLFHVIDAKTSYELLLGRTWLHENGVIASTWHQCFKYNDRGNEKYVVAECEPFTNEESHYADAKFYLDNE
ncbi:LOW QUALITY PROTEIN: hypothetical protein CFOL_v3_05740 [Cephalotus follicularis]|uniref:Uncharacterized protein n=1 Tax=Cephalotus follicularis TaxID=3775 RepID=A0A1Q3B2H0_CEPFO|nr:LOW QUALITY PROTEIN: hypothetical protein CFOL_v3_05740 [Cephalotus follicularis]